MASPYRDHRSYSPLRHTDSPSKRTHSVDRASHSNSRRNSPHTRPEEHSTASFLAYPVSRVASSLYRRLTEDLNGHPRQQSLSTLQGNTQATNGSNGAIYTPNRTASPFAPPPLTGLTLRGHKSPKQQILSRGLAEEIRLLLPPRLQLAADWILAYSVETDGVSLATLYDRCMVYAGKGHGFVLVVKDSSGGVSSASQYRKTKLNHYRHLALI